MFANLNIINVPLPNKSKNYSLSTESISTVDGYVSNGYNEVFVNLKSPSGKPSEIIFNIVVNSISVESFNTWRKEISVILGASIIKQIENIISSEISDPIDIKFEQYMSIYSLLVFEYALNSDFHIEKLANKSNIAFTVEQSADEQFARILKSIYRLEPKEIHFNGKLVATEMYPESHVYFPLTVIQFNDSRVVSFASYSGPVTIIDKDEISYKSRIVNTISLI